MIPPTARIPTVRSARRGRVERGSVSLRANRVGSAKFLQIVLAFRRSFRQHAGLLGRPPVFTISTAPHSRASSPTIRHTRGSCRRFLRLERDDGGHPP